MRRLLLLVTIFFVCVSFPETAAEGKAWNSLEPLHSKKVEVLRLLGPPSAMKEGTLIFERKTEEVAIILSNSDDKYICGEDLEPDIVMAIEVVPREPKAIEAVAPVLTPFEKFERRDERGDCDWYFDRSQGFAFKVSGKKVVKLEFMADDKDSKRCLHYYDNYRTLQNYSTTGYWELFCPYITVSCAAQVSDKDDHVSFTANIVGPPNMQPSYKWSVSGGTILSGQGTPAFTASPAKGGEQSVTATVEVNGIPSWCPKTSSCTTRVTTEDGKHPRVRP